MPDQSRAHTVLVREVLVELSKLPNVLAVDNPSGFDARAKSHYGAFGPGAPDVLAVVAMPSRGEEHIGRLVAIECKTAAGKQDAEQIRCQSRLERFGVRYVVARSVQDALDAVTGHGVR